MSDFPKIDGYHLDCLLGQGGQGAVYGGKRLSDGRKVAIKVLRLDFINNESRAFSRFRREIAVSKNFAHANVIRILDGGIAGGRHFLVMDYLEGESLFNRMVRGSISDEELLKIFLDLAEALDYIHAQGLVHRDIKPANVWLCKDGRTVLLDFGLCFVPDITRLTETGCTVGTVATIAPEQIMSKGIGPYTDIYSLGATIFFAATGTPPYGLDDLLLIGVGREPKTIKTPSFALHSFSDHLSKIIMKCIEVRPKNRFQSAQELRSALTRDESSDEHVVEVLPEAPKSNRKAFGAFGAIGAIFLLLCILAFFVWSHGREKKESQKANFSLLPAYHELVKKESWTDKEFIEFGKKVIALGQAEKFGIYDEADDPFVVGCYSVINHLSMIVQREQKIEKKASFSRVPLKMGAKHEQKTAALFLRLFDYLGKNALRAPNADFIRLLTIENHQARADGRVIMRLKKLLDDLSSEGERLTCEFRLADALFLSMRHSPHWMEESEPPQILQQANWLISPAMERFYEGRLLGLNVYFSDGELLAKYAEILDSLRTKDSKEAMNKLIKNMGNAQFLDNDCRAIIFRFAMSLNSSPVRGEKTIGQDEMDRAISFGKIALELVSANQRLWMQFDMLAHAQRFGFYDKLKKALGCESPLQFPKKFRHRFLLLEAEQANRRGDLKSALTILQKAANIAPPEDRDFIESRMSHYQGEMGAFLGFEMK